MMMKQPILTEIMMREGHDSLRAHGVLLWLPWFVTLIPCTWNVTKTPCSSGMGHPRLREKLFA
eukprot:scaffold75090_cov15-Tisochrysis_lutea.AAC.1